MLLSNAPSKLLRPFADAGGRNSIPVASQIGVTPGAASLTDGFPPLTRTPVAAGGVPPSGQDMNGILYELSAITRWANAGGGYPFDGTFAADTNVNGYPVGARVLRADGQGYWFNTADGNTTDPETSGAAAAGWVPDFQAGAAAITMTSANVTLTPAQYGKPLIVITGALTANLNLVFPALARNWTVVNDTTGGFTITAKTAAGSGISLQKTGIVVCDGADVRKASPESVLLAPTVSALRAMTPTPSTMARTSGYGSLGGAGASYYYAITGAPSGTYVDNGFTVIRPTSGDGSAAWLLCASGSIAIEQAGALGLGLADETSAIELAFSVAASLKLPVTMCSGIHLNQGLHFGSQSTSRQSLAPLGLYGDGGETILRAHGGYSGTVLQAWSVAGVEFHGFDVDGASSAATAIDTDWKAGVGPSLQNIYSRIRAYGCTSTVWTCKDNNDCTFLRCTVSGASHSVTGFNLVASGGLAWMQDCTWNNCYLKFGAQNGVLYNCWGHGIQFAQKCTNYVGLVGGYFYGNTHLNAVLSSESFSSFQSVHGLTALSTQFIGEGVSAYFNLNAYSTLDFYTCQWTGSATAMFGTSCRADSFSPVKCLFRGGSLPSILGVNTPSGFIIEQDGLMDDGTATNRPNKRSSIYASGTAAVAMTSGTYYDLISAGILEEGTYLIDWSWNHNGAGQPYLLHGSAIISILASDPAAGAFGPDIAANLNSYVMSDGQALAFRLASTSTSPKIQVKWTQGAASGPTLNLPGNYAWKAVKLA